MPIYRLLQKVIFPDPSQAESDGLLAVGGDLSPQRLLVAYANGIFPWPYRADWPLLWFSPDPRTVLLPSALHVSRSLRRSLNQDRFNVRLDTAFDRVIQACAEVDRSDQSGTWIFSNMIEAYCDLHELGYAHSAESWVNGELVGGVYGISLGAVFFGESMFASQSDASKVAFVHLVWQLQKWGFHFIDCQMETDHLARFGAVAWSRDRFFQALKQALQVPTRRGKWVAE